MSSYPRLIHTQEGSGLIFEGHDLDATDVLAKIQHDMEPLAVDVSTEEVWVHLHPRVKNCADYGGPCDLEGEWHAHWEPVKASPGAAFTIAYPDTTDTSQEAGQ
ncbi:hypothetical protein [Kineococcus radiotolerans]|uniref:Uncharacterized protein n=1 Tax=Kineococcus radiotolerans (strain ATCC BAA-149 / DSM 14245 / SRS30216) TaxID=266940 RepID=A6W8U0_KINRD|nr:hypothetical protein [Kineococcus radiotolerans]ABS03229.1 hypothetical protein Krad_1743 [Kineococcus radiotolerans SRS30216 = ATCC BAA-149]